jgi:hypothetical protein
LALVVAWCGELAQLRAVVSGARAQAEGLRRLVADAASIGGTFIYATRGRSLCDGQTR